MCDPGFEQTFHMEVLSPSDNVIDANVSGDVYIRVFASNNKGRCTPVILQVETSMAAGVS